MEQILSIVLNWQIPSYQFLHLANARRARSFPWNAFFAKIMEKRRAITSVMFSEMLMELFNVLFSGNYLFLSLNNFITIFSFFFSLFINKSTNYGTNFNCFNILFTGLTHVQFVEHMVIKLTHSNIVQQTKITDSSASAPWSHFATRLENVALNKQITWKKKNKKNLH